MLFAILQVDSTSKVRINERGKDRRGRSRTVFCCAGLLRLLPTKRSQYCHPRRYLIHARSSPHPTERTPRFRSPLLLLIPLDVEVARTPNLNSTTLSSSTMAEPPAAKKQRASKPIVFVTPGYQPDVRLVVFDQEFHVHSILLKLHSAYFRKFLDSPDKAPKVTNAVSAGATDGFGSTAADSSRSSMKGPQGSFKYRWVTKIDGDDNPSWYLTAAKSDVSHRRPFDELLLMTRT